MGSHEQLEPLVGGPILVWVLIPVRRRATRDEHNYGLATKPIIENAKLVDSGVLVPDDHTLPAAEARAALRLPVAAGNVSERKPRV